MSKLKPTPKLISLIFGLILSTSTFATYQAPCHPYNPAPRWKNSFGLYGWIFGQCGSMRVNGNNADVDVSVGDVIGNLNLIDFIL